MKKQKPSLPPMASSTHLNFFDLLSEELLFTILDYLSTNPQDKKSFSLVCKSFYSIESKHRRILKPLRSEHLPSILSRFLHVETLDLSLCPRITDFSLSIIASAACAATLTAVDLSKSKFFTGNGLSVLVTRCRNLKVLDLSNSSELRDSGAAVIGEAKNLERLWLGRCKMITDIGIGCIAVGCPKLKMISLKWCLGVGDLGVELVALKCKELRCLDLSYLPGVISFVAYAFSGVIG